MPVDNSDQCPPPEQVCATPPLLASAVRAVYFSALSLASRKPLWQYAIDNNDINRIISLTEQYPADLNSTLKFQIPSLQAFAGDDHECTPLSYALRQLLWKPFSEETIEILSCLLELGANPNISDKNNGKPYGTAFSNFVIHALPSCMSSTPLWTQKQWILVIRLLLSHGADPNLEYDTADYIRLNPNTYVQPPKVRTILTDFARLQHHALFPQTYSGLIEILSKCGKLEPNKIVNGRTALDYAFEQYFANFRLINGKLVELWSEEDIWAISELICAGASKVTKKLSINVVPDPRQYAVDESFVVRIFEQSLLLDMRSRKCAATNLVSPLQDIFDIQGSRALLIAEEMVRQVGAKRKRKSAQLMP